MTGKHVALAATALALVILGPLAWQRLGGEADPFADCRTAQIAGGAGTIGGPFSLVDETGKAVSERDMITGPTLVYFGYTFCPDVCPMDNARNAAAVDILEERGITVTPLLISVDPKRDTPKVMAEFTDLLHPRMIGLTGTEEQVHQAAQAYKAYYKVHDDGSEYYLVDHSTFTYLMMPELGFMDYFNRDATPDQMAEQIACFVEKAG